MGGESDLPCFRCFRKAKSVSCLRQLIAKERAFGSDHVFTNSSDSLDNKETAEEKILAGEGFDTVKLRKLPAKWDIDRLVIELQNFGLPMKFVRLMPTHC